jgi:hypothetical protein
MSTILELIEEKKRERERINAVISQLEAALAIEQGAGPQKPRLTILKMAEEVLKEEKRPMKSKEIAERIQSKFGSYVKTTSIGTMLYRRAVESKKIFVKDKKDENTYGLIEWER